jgi:fibronectin type 3 domain-containing protein
MRRLILLAILAGLAGALPAGPPPPAGLTATATGLSQQVALQWTAVTATTGALSGYHVYYNTVSDLAGATDQFVTGTATLLTGPPLADRVQTWFFMAAEDMGSGLGSTGTAVAATPYQPPSAPALSGQALPYGTQFSLGWTTATAYGSNNNNSIGAYRVEMKTSASTGVLANLPDSALAATVTAVCGQGVSLSVRAYDDYGSSGAASAPIFAFIPCAPNFGDSGQLSSLTPGKLTLSWAQGPGAASFEVLSSTVSADPSPSTVTITTLTNFLVTLPAQASPLFVRLRAANAQGLTSSVSSELSLLPAPTDLVATPSKGAVLLRWSAPSGAAAQGVTAYQVFYAAHTLGGFGDPSDLSLVAAAVVGTPQAVTVSGLTDHADYNFRIASLGGGQVGPESGTVTARPALPDPVFSAAATTNTSLALTWTAVAGGSASPVTYTVFRVNDLALNGAVLITATTGTTVLTPTASSGDYYYYVAVSDSSGAYSEITPPASALAYLPTLLSPTVAVESTGNGRVRLTWSQDPTATSYAVYRASGSAWQPLPGGVVNSTEFIDTAPVNGGANVYQVYAQRPSGFGSGLLLSPASSPITGTPTVAPGIPGSYGTDPVSGVDLGYVTAVARVDGGVDLLWTPAGAGSSVISGYHLWRGWSVQSLSAISFVAGATSSAYSETPSVQPNTGLIYGVEAEDLQGVIGPRAFGQAGPAVPWPVPPSLNATVMAGGVRLSWGQPQGQGSYPLSGYAVSRRWLAGGPYDLLVTVSTTAYVDLSADARQGSQPSYQVQVLDSGGGLGPGVTLTAFLSPVGLALAVPSAVSGAKAQPLALSGTPVLVSWRPNPQAELVNAYKVYNGASLLTQTAGLTWTDYPGLGSTASYSVQAVSAQGSGVSGTALPSPILVAPPQPPVLSAITTVQPAREGLALGLRLAWSDLGAPTNLDGYDLYAQFGAFTGITNATLLTQTASASFEDLALSPSAQVSYAVLGRSGAYSSASPVAQLQLTLPPAPGALSGLTATPTSSGAQLSWTPNPNAQEYWVYRSVVPLDDHPVASSPYPVRVTVPYYTDSGAQGNLWQDYAVAAVNALGRGPASLLPVSPVAGTPTNLVLQGAYDPGSPTVQLSWGAPAGTAQATAYEVWRAMSPSVLPYGGSSVTQTTGLSYVDPVSTTNTAYYYAVVGQGFSPSTPLIGGPARVYTQASAPAALTATGAAGGVDFSWTPASSLQGVTAWALSLDVSGSASTVLLGVSLTSYHLQGLSPSVQADLSIQALNSAGASAPSVTVSARANSAGAAPLPTFFKALSGFSGGLTTQAKVEFSWSAPGAGTVLLYQSSTPMALSLAAGGPVSPLYLSGVSASLGLVTVSSQALGQVYDFALSAVSVDGLPLGESAPVVVPQVLIRRSASLPGLSGTAGDGRIDLAWSVPADGGSNTATAAFPYRLHRQSGGTAPSLGSIVEDAGFPQDLSGTTYVDKAVINGINYWYLLSVLDAQGLEGAVAAVVKDKSGAEASLQPLGPPLPPSPIIGLPGDHTASFRWVSYIGTTASGGKYNIYRRLTSPGADYAGAVPELSGVGPSTVSEYGSLSYTVLTLRDPANGVSPPVNKTTYAYSISAINAWGEGPKSPEIFVTPFRPLDPRMGVSGTALSAQVSGKIYIQLNWGPTPDQVSTDGYDLAYYRVYRSQDGGTTYTLIADNLSALNYLDKTTTFGTAYTYRVVPVDTQLNEGLSYDLQTVVIPAAVNSLLLFRNAIYPVTGDPMSSAQKAGDSNNGMRLPLQYAIQQPGHVWVKVFTLNGEYVATLFNEDVPVASPDRPFLSDRKFWDGLNSDGQLVASGVYLVHMEGPGFRQNARVAVIK